MLIPPDAVVGKATPVIVPVTTRPAAATTAGIVFEVGAGGGAKNTRIVENICNLCNKTS